MTVFNRRSNIDANGNDNVDNNGDNNGDNNVNLMEDLI